MDDGLLVNFEASDTAVQVSSSQYKGRWKERALSKKWDRIKAKRQLSGRTQEPHRVEHDERQASPVQNDLRPLKRRRTATSANATPVISRDSTSSSLFTSNPDIPISKPREAKFTIQPAPISSTGDFTSLGIS